MPDCNRRVLTSEQVTLKPQGEREEEETEWEWRTQMNIRSSLSSLHSRPIQQQHNHLQLKIELFLCVSHPTWERTKSCCSSNYTLLPYYTSSSQFNVWLHKALILLNVSSTQYELQQKDSCYFYEQSLPMSQFPSWLLSWFHYRNMSMFCMNDHANVCPHLGGM